VFSQYRTKFEPIKPAPPVTKMVAIFYSPGGFGYIVHLEPWRANLQ
jgi:hypothetical protein